MSDKHTATSGFGQFVARARRAGHLVVQPRMGFSDPKTMQQGLIAVERSHAVAAGTITVDSYTRVGDHEAVTRALADGVALNGYPIVDHDDEINRQVLARVSGPEFPVQVRHGSAKPQDIVTALVKAGLDATEGGPISYCLPYGRVPLRVSVANWAESCTLLGELREQGVEPHLETFGGCMMGQLCPPGLLVAISMLEGLYFRQHGIRSISLSYAMQTNPAQDREAVRALRRLAGRLMPDVNWHVVVYAYMGVFPRSKPGALRLAEDAAELATSAGAARLIVKTAAEAHRIPTIQENVEALELASLVSETSVTLPDPLSRTDTEVYTEASAILDAVLNLDGDIGAAILKAFALGLLDVPFCLHADNAGATSSYIDDTGRLRWAETGALPIPASAGRTGQRMTAGELLEALSYMQRRYDETTNGTHDE